MIRGTTDEGRRSRSPRCWHGGHRRRLRQAATTTAAPPAPRALTATPDINVPVDKKIAAQVPSSIKSSGTLSVAADATYAPNEFIAADGNTVIGMDADLAKAIAQVMGLKADVKNVTFDSIIPGLAANKYDLGMSSFTITKEREKTVDFVTYAIAGTSFFVKADGGPNIAVARRPLRPQGRRGAGNDPGGRRDRAGQEVHGRRQARASASASSPTRTASTWRCRAVAPTSRWPTRRRAAYAVEQSDGKFKLSGKPVRDRALRDRDAQGQRPGEAGARRRSRP